VLLVLLFLPTLGNELLRSFKDVRVEEGVDPTAADDVAFL
jgi:hypothetical protein